MKSVRYATHTKGGNGLSKWHCTDFSVRTLCGRMIPTKREENDNLDLIDCKNCKKVAEGENILPNI